ncbi:MAG: nucleotidyltransferase, partial [Firmicutes bacterium]|nr:nucleotidyltransferase [Bacillota bacterium]
DYYGPGAFSSLYDYLTKHDDDDKYEFCMAGYKLENTVTENGHVARGVCELDEDGYLVGVTERTKIEMKEEGIAFTEDDGESWTVLPEGTVVSMNFWGFSAAMMKELEAGLPAFLDKALTENPLKGEYLLPFIVDSLIKNGKARVKVLTSPDKWCGVTYKEDKEDVKNTLEAMKDKGLYPEKLWK